jgi:Uncharacterized protein conserved in bacteria C-term(DUF2220)
MNSYPQIVNKTAILALEKLLSATENFMSKDAENSRAVQVKFSTASFPEYFNFDRAKDKIEFREALEIAERYGAIELVFHKRSKEYLIAIKLKDCNKLAGFIGVMPRWSNVSQARETLQPLLQKHRVLKDVLDVWEKGGLVRKAKPSAEAVLAFCDAARLIEYCNENNEKDMLIRKVSVRLFGDSKRIDGLSQFVDILANDSIAYSYTKRNDVFDAIGLVSMHSEMLIAASPSVDIEFIFSGLKAVPAVQPYIGIDHTSLSGVKCETEGAAVISVENKTSFHEAKIAIEKSTVKIIAVYSGGMPSPSWRRAYKMILKSLKNVSSVLHWGDTDLGGFRIAEVIKKDCDLSGYRLNLHMMGDKPVMTGRGELNNSAVKYISEICTRNGWIEEMGVLEESRQSIEQEAQEFRMPTGIL